MEHTLSDFLHTVLPESGYVCLGRLAPRKGSPFLHDVYDSVSDMLAALENADYTKENYYFAISSLAERSVVERGKKRVRTQKNAKFTKAIILDVDVKNEDGYYLDKEEAWEGLSRISFQLGMPEPIIVDSGFGYHVYWPLLVGIPSHEWQAAAKLFYQALLIVEPKAVADASRVSDSASVLRIPESFNLKFNQQTPVGIVQWHSDLLDFGDFRESLRRITGKRAGAPVVNLETESKQYEPAPFKATMRNCNWSKHYMTHMADAAEPEWYAMLGLAPFMEHTAADGTVYKGLDLAHIMSKVHPEYTPDTTERKYLQAKVGQSGPTTCSKFQQINPKHCEGCPFRDAVKSPVQTGRLSRPMETAQVVPTVVVDEEGNKQEEHIIVPVPPKPYFRGEDGGVFVREKIKVEVDGTEEWQETITKIYDYDLYPVKRFRSELMEEEQLEIHLWLPKDGMRKFKMPAENLVEHKKLGSFLASRGAIGEFGKSIPMAKYLIDYARHMQTQEGAEVEYSRFGWRDVHGENPKFVVGNGFIDKEGITHPAAFPSYLRNAATSVATYGSLDKWKNAFGVYNRIPNSEPFIFAAMMGFAAPGMALTPYAGVLFNMVGASGAGKSAALRIMSSVWGMPHEARVNVNDTQIAMYNTIGYLNAVPVAFDEVTTMDAQVASQFALNFTGGRGKERAGRDGQNKDNHVTWDTIVVCSSNTSMYSKFTMARKGYNAEAMRLFEVNVPDSKEEYKSMMDNAQATLRENYGMAGRAFIGMVMRNREKISKAIETKANWVLAQTKGSNSERFWATLVACVYVMGSIAKKQGLHTYDMDELTSWAMGQMHVARDTSGKSAADPKAMLGEFINRNLDSLIRVRDGQVDLTLANPNISPRSIKGRLEYQGDKLVNAVLSNKALADFCNSSHIDNSWLLTELVRLGVTDGASSPKRLATGTNFPNPTVRSITFDMSAQSE